MRRAFVAACGWVLFSCASCAGGPEGKGVTQSARGASDNGCFPEPILDAAVAFVPSKSRVALVLEVGEKTVQQIFDHAVLSTVAQGKGINAGVAGRAAYEVTRGALNVAITRDGVRFGTPLHGDIQLCKPFGAVCFGYGRCYPEWDANVIVPKEVTQSHTPHVDFDLQLRKGCVLSPVRFDATSELKKITQQQEQRIEEQINRAVSKHFKRLRETVRSGFGTAPLRTGDCIAIKPEGAQVSLQTSGEGAAARHTLVTQVTGVVALGCERAALDPSFAVAVSDNVADDTHVAVEKVLSWAAIEQDWAKVNPRVSVSLRTSGSAVVVRLAPFGGCGAAWGKFSVEASAAGIVLKPEHVTHEALSAWVAQRGPLFAEEVAHHELVMTELLQRGTGPVEASSALSKEWALEFSPALKATRSVRVVTEGLVLLGQLEGQVRGHVRAVKH